MAIRRPDKCAGCSEPLPPKTRAWWDSVERTVTCTACQSPDAPTEKAPQPLPPPQPIDHGVGGVSAQNEYERRAQRHQQRTQVAAFGTGIIGEVTASAETEPHHLAAWAKGADGERRLAAHLDHDLAGIATPLHDRRVPKTRGNIDHLVIAHSGVWIIDAKNYTGKVERRNAGTRRRPEQRLYVKNRNQTKLVDRMEWQFDAVRSAVDTIGFGGLPIFCCLCFTNAEWPMFSKPFVIGKVWVGWATALTSIIPANPVMDACAVATVAQHLSAQLPASGANSRPTPR